MQSRLTTNFVRAVAIFSSRCNGLRRAPAWCVGCRRDGAYHLAKPAVGWILVDSRVPDGVELHNAQFAGRVEYTSATRVGKLRDHPSRNGQDQVGAGQDIRPQYVLRHDDSDATSGVACLERLVYPRLADVDAQMRPAHILRQ